MLALPLSTKLTFASVDLAQTAWENVEDIQSVVNIANDIAPEHKQIDFLVKKLQVRPTAQSLDGSQVPL